MKTIKPGKFHSIFFAMLTTLRIKNLALVTDLTLELQPGFIAITGETGAGKSIIIGALNLILGQRADRNAIRSGADRCTVEAVFDIRRLAEPIQAFLEKNGLEPCEETHLMIKRALAANGSNRQFVNGSPTTLATLAGLGEHLVDIHGPHDHQSLLHHSKQLEIMDAFCGLQQRRDRFAQLLLKRRTLGSEKAELIVDERTYAQQLDLLRFQVQEITSAKLQPSDGEDLEDEYQRAGSASRRVELGQATLNQLSEGEESVIDRSGAVGRFLDELQRLDPQAASLHQLHQQIIELLNELQTNLRRYLDRIEIDPRQLEALEQRIDLIQSLKRKYGATIEDILQFGEKAQAKLRTLEQRDAELDRINQALQSIETDLWRIGKKLTAERQRAIPKICAAVVKELNDLGFNKSRFEIHLKTLTPNSNGTTTTFHPSGLDTVEFMFGPNPGEPLRPLKAIASSGEMARVMLALKTVLASVDQIPILVFDEVDANIGGETANVVGKKMQQIGEQRQTFCVTHLAQVAAAAGTHFLVSKAVRSNRTVSEIRILTQKQRIEEITRMLGGRSAAAKKHARALLK